ncbi:MAG: hypothetical protein ABIF40_04800 [archaeon]
MTDFKNRDDVPKDLQTLLNSIKKYQGEYEYERDYLKVYEKLKDTNPFSVLVFYENHFERTQKKVRQRKKLNPFMPERMLAGFARYIQFYFTPELEEMRLGSNPGSGYRVTQRVYALSLAKLSETKDIPTHILLLDKDETVKHVYSSPTLIVQPHEVILNESSEAYRILKNTTKAYSRTKEDLIESIFLL